MNWFFIALAAPFLWALVNIADKYLVSRYAKGERGSGGLVLFSSLIGIFIAIGIGIFTPGISDIPALDQFLLLLTGALTVGWVILYLFTLEVEDVSVVIPWFLTIPIFGYIFSYLFLGETLTLTQKAGSLVVLLGLAVLSFNFSGEAKTKFKIRTMLYMGSASIMLALIGVIFKYVTVEGNFWVSSFWEYFGLGVSGIFIYILVPKFRRQFNFMNKEGGATIFSLNVLSEAFTSVGNMLTNFAILLAPVTMVYLVGSFQPAILLGLTILGTYLFPKIIQENLDKKVLVPKIIAIAIMIIGSMILFS